MVQLLRSLVLWRPMPYVLALLCTVVIFGIHMLPSVDSMLNENNTRISHVFLRSQINYHKEIAPFARRPLTTLLIETAQSVFKFKAGHAFILVNFLLLGLSGALTYRLSLILKATKKQGIINMLVFFASFSVLFAFFPPVFTYDEPLQYCFLLTAIMAFVGRRWFAFVSLFTLALVARETSILLWPALVLFFPGTENNPPQTLIERFKKKGLYLLLPVFLYGCYIVIFIHQQSLLHATHIEMASRYSCFLENIESVQNSVESVVSILITLGPFLYFTYFYLHRQDRLHWENKFVSAFLLTLAFNTPIVFLTAFARESRLFALPLLFIWPMFMQLFGKDISPLFTKNGYIGFLKNWRTPLLFTCLTAANFAFCFIYYPYLGLGSNTYFAEYIFGTVLLLTLHFCSYRTLGTKEHTTVS
ncbi:hypothetical protein [Zobellia galactanivorans]|uniref:hypothetical protein n=1 Tax=Zobellia galactanivorans (strain DSM 12802 / CCUG 47099 / CIP 106680 / NCIMB 13871 / Dsij) TaxID=63186 RepID=UPI001C066104|nr:hypothetical protein [Zobellia galactanivorans]MBU3027092.1 hypothetical protein [Zobellia galactanivorans]